MEQAVLLQPIELTDAELDAVSAGQNQTGLVNAADILNRNEVLNNAHVQVAVGVLSGILQRQP